MRSESAAAAHRELVGFLARRLLVTMEAFTPNS